MLPGVRKTWIAAALVLYFYFEEVNCAQIFNGACEDWRPGSPLVKNVYK